MNAIIKFSTGIQVKQEIKQSRWIKISVVAVGNQS